jgi:WD40 repeat protein
LPERIGRFEVRSRLGSGGFGTVYRAYDPQMHREVALKVPMAGILSVPQKAERFLREARAAGSLHHPHIVPVYEAGGESPNYYLACAYVQGRTLEEVATQEPLSFERVAQVVHDLADALAYAHEQGIVHRDVKPSNVLVDGKGEVHLADFGLAYRHDGGERLTQEGDLAGTPAYIAPEQLQEGEDRNQPPIDQYSLGVLLYELLTGRLPFEGPADVVLFQVSHSEPPPPRSVQPQVPRDLETICLKCLRKEPRERYASTGELAEDLQHYLRNEPIRARRLSRRERVWRWCKRNPAVAGLSLLTMAVLIAGTAISSYFAVEASNRAESESVARQNAVALADEKSQTVEALRDNLFVADLRAAQAALDEGDVDRGLALLQKHHPKPGEVDRRGFAWHHLMHRCRHSHGVLLETDPQLYAMALSPDGNTLVVSQGERTRIRFLDPAAGKLRWEADCIYDQGKLRWFPSEPGDVPGGDGWSHESARSHKPYQVAFSPDGTTMAVACGRGESRARGTYQYSGVFLFNAQGGKSEPRPLSEDATVGVCVAFSPQGTLLACGAPGGKVELWDYRSHKRIASLEGHKKDVEALAFTPDGARLISAAYGESVRVWRVEDARLERILITHPYRIPFQDTYYTHSFWRYQPVGLAVSPDGKVLATAENGPAVRLWELPGFRSLGVLQGHADAIGAVAFTRDSQRLITGSLDRDVRLWDVKNLAEVNRLGSHRDVVTAVLVTADGNHVLTGGDDGYVRKWKLPRPDEPPDGLKGSSWFRGLIYSLAFSPDGEILAAGGWAYSIPLQDPGTGRLIRTLTGFKGRVPSLAFSPTDPHLACANGDEQVVDVWDVHTGERKYREKQVGWVNHVAYSPDGKRLAVSDSKGVHVREASTGQLIHSFAGTKPAFSPDGRFLACVDRSAIVLRDATTTNAVLTIPAQSGSDSDGPLPTALTGDAIRIAAPVFSHDSRFLAFLEGRKAIVLWDVEGRRVLHRIAGHFAAISGLVFCRDGTTLATVAEDGRCILWDLVTGKQTITLRGSGAELHAIAISNDGRALATAGLDQFIRLYRAPGQPEAGSGPRPDLVNRALNFNQVEGEE